MRTNPSRRRRHHRHQREVGEFLSEVDPGESEIKYRGYYRIASERRDFRTGFGCCLHYATVIRL
jgi:hypothetical protein